MSDAGIDPGGMERDDALDRLVRDAMAGLSTDVEWPSNEVIHAYISGTCTPEQRDLVQFALSRSSEFREYMVDAAEGVAQARSAELQAAFDDAGDMVPIPDRDTPPSTPSIVDQLWDWLRKLLSPRIAAPALAAVAVLVLAFGLQSPTEPPTEMLAFAPDSQMELADFVTMTTREMEEDQGAAKPALSARQAAVRALQDCVSYNMASDSFTLTPGKTRGAAPESTRQIELRIQKDEIAPPVIITTKIPFAADRIHTPVKAWLMVPPSLKLWSVDITGNSTILEWPEPEATQGCLTVTYSLDKEFYATPGQVVTF